MLPDMLAMAGAGRPPVEGDLARVVAAVLTTSGGQVARALRLPPRPRSTSSTTTCRSKSRLEDRTMETKGFVAPPGRGRVWEMTAGRSSALKLLGGETGESVMMF